MAALPPLARMALVALALPALAGCSFSDWYNSQGTVRIHLAPGDEGNSSLSEFGTLRVAVLDVSVKQVRILDAKHISFRDQPLVAELAGLARDDGRALLGELKLNLRPIESITLTVDVVEAIRTTGESVPVCREGEPAPAFPCFFTTRSGALRLEGEEIPVPRGGAHDATVPLLVRSTVQEGKTEYFLVVE